jgi:hypothetical protein
MRFEYFCKESARFCLLLLTFQVSLTAAEFHAGREYPVGVHPAAAAVGDFNSDGKLDIVVANRDSGTVSVLLGNGDGTFRKAVNYRIGAGPQSVAVGDIDGDGSLDIAVANTTTNSVTVLLGRGDGTFHGARTYGVGVAPRAVTLGDVNRDGKFDLVTANSGSDNITVLIGKGDGTFRPAQNYRVGSQPGSLILSDFNGDGLLDIAIANAGSDDITLLMGKGDGTFQRPQTLRVGKNPSSIAAPDLDGDGKTDLVVMGTGSKNVHVLLGQGDGTFRRVAGYSFGSQLVAMVTGDFNSEQKLSIAVVNPEEKSIGILIGNGDGTFQPGANLDARPTPSAIAVGDFNGDGAPDLIVANETRNSITVFLNSPRVQFTPATVQFTTRQGGTRGPGQKVTLTNAGSAPLSITSIVLTGGDVHDYALQNNCPLAPLTLGARQACTLHLRFTPKAKGNSKAGLLITDNAEGSPHLLPLNAGPAASTIWLGGVGNWSDSTKWSAGVPTATTDALIDNGNTIVSPVTLDIGGQTNNITVDADDSLSFNNGTSLTINGSSVSNAGTISLNSAGGLTTLFVAGGATLSGAGTVTMSNNSQNQVDGNGGATLTNQSTIQGVGMIGPHFNLTNQGTINANVSGAALILGPGSAATYTNSSTMEATNGGILQLSLQGISNTGGTIKAVGTNSQVQFAGGGDNITGGTLTTSGGGTIVQNASTSSTLTTLTNSGTFSLLNNSTVNLTGTITNTGTFQLNSAGSLTTLFVPTGATLSGTGTVTMSNNSQNQVDGNGGATLTNQSTIQGVGMVGPHFNFINNGTVNANVSGAALILGPGSAATYTNTATMEATNGGILQLNLQGITNTGGTIKAVGTNSQVQFTGGADSIAGGTLTTSGGGTMVQNASTTSTLSTLTNSGTFSLLNNATVNLSGTITNTGTFSLKSTGSLTTLFVPSAATLTGTGTVTLSNNSQNQVDGNGGATLTNQSTIQGVGMIGPHFNLTNKGTINANVSGATLILGPGSAATYTNASTMEATNGGILQLSLQGISNTGGTIKAVGTNSQVQFAGGGDNITGGTLTTSGGGTIVQTGGTATLTGLTNSGTFSILNGNSINLSGTITNTGTFQVNSSGGLTELFVPSAATLAGKGTVVLNNNPSSAIDGNGGATLTNQSTIQGGGTIGPHFTFNNKGTISVPASNTLNINGPFVNFSGTTLKGGKYQVTGTLQFTGANIVTNAANLTLTGASAQIIDQNGANGLANFAANGATGIFALGGNRTFTTSAGFRNSGTVTIPAGNSLSISKSYTQSAGTTTVDGTLKARGLINIQAGNVFGTETFAGSVDSSGIITPGDSSTQTGSLAITGTYTQTSTGSLNISIGGNIAGSQFGQLNVTKAATLDGTLNLTLINGFVPNIGETFDILNASSVSGTFATINTLCINSNEQFSITYGSSGVFLAVVAGGCM